MGNDQPAGQPTMQDAHGEFSPEVIHAQLDRILAHPEFHATDKMRDFLRFVIEETLDGRAHRLKGYTIATEVFGRSDDFDAAHDPIVRIQAGRLRRALERYYLVAGGRDPIYIDIPKGHYIPHFRSQTVTTGAARPGTWSSQGAENLALTGPTVAVLPLEDLTGDPEKQFFTAGLADELVTALSRFQDIVVMSFRRLPEGLAVSAEPIELGRATGARFLLRGTVRRDPVTVKVSMQLNDATTGKQNWANAYKHPLEAANLIATQEEIARSVVAAIGSEYGIIARRLSAESRKKAPAQLSTYEAMLCFYGYLAAPSVEGGEACFAALQKAAEREPEYGPVWSALASFHCEMYTYDAPDFDRSLETAVDYARRGVSLDPGSQFARMTLAFALCLAEDFIGFRQEVETALALNPNSSTLVGCAGYLYAIVGEFERGRSLMDRALRANPFHPSWFHEVYTFDHFYRGEYELAYQEFEMHRPDDDFWSTVLHIALLGKLDRDDEATTHIEELEKVKPDFAPRARELIRRCIKVDALIDDVIDGLRRAGLTIEE